MSPLLRLVPELVLVAAKFVLVPELVLELAVVKLLLVLFQVDLLIW
jgi:hypothetical protein